MNTKKQFSFDGIYAPLPVRWVNGLGRISKPVFDRLASLKKENLLEAAERRIGLRDWGDPRFKDALAALLDSVNQEGKLTFFGSFALRQFLIENLCSRLRLIEVLKRYPEIQQQKIQSPIFITGWYRTGTTHLHHLLASHPAARAPLFWELRHPCPTLDPRCADPRRQIRKVRIESRIQHWLVPGFSAVHPLEAERPEECLHLFDKACAGTTSFFITEAQSFAWWLLDHGIQHGYDFFKIQLQLLNWLRPGRQWMLKWPYHLWHLDALLKTFPDATIVQLHRDPCQAIPSVCSLAALARSSFCESIDVAALGKFWLDYYEAGLARGFKARSKFNKKQIIDIRYSDLKLNPRSAVKQIQNAIKLDGAKAWTESIERSSSATLKKVRGHHRYASAQFGLNTDQIRERFSRYMEDFDLST
ncbi:MAG: sulfotransferase [Deltaproteobacteria bacterium]|nr:sulfotransferase [Deltaproteobacteria bacterium]